MFRLFDLAIWNFVSMGYLLKLTAMYIVKTIMRTLKSDGKSRISLGWKILNLENLCRRF